MIAALLASLLAPPPDAACDAAFERLRARNAVEAAFVAHVAYVRADPGDGRPRWFLIDTGANRSALDAGVVRSLDLPDLGATTVEGTAGVVQTSTTRLESLTLGDLTASLSPTVSDLSGLAGPGGEAVAGILGSDLMGGRVLVLDFERDRLAISTGSETDAAAACGISVPIRDDNGIPRLEAEVDGQALPLRYDSGAGIFDSPHLWLNLSEDQFARVRGDRPAAPPVMTLGGGGTGGALSLPVHMGATARMGDLEWSEPRLIVQPRQGYFAREDAVGFIGNAAFRPFGLLVVDYPGGRLILPRRPVVSADGSSPESPAE